MASEPEIELKKREFAKEIWPGITDATRFEEVPQPKGTVTYRLPSGKLYTAELKWFTVSRGPRIFGYYDDDNDVCYVGKFVEQP